jgi:hypothetical protein
MSLALGVTGFASCTSCGVQRGLPDTSVASLPQVVTLWQTPAPRLAYQVPPFRVTDVVPGLRVRRLDRLSVWALVSATLALESAGLMPGAVDGDRGGVACGSSLGCQDRTQDFLAALAENPAKADPILFPETLPNLAAGHVARHFGIRGPNLTLMAGALSGETALIEAAALIGARAADRVLVLAGDCLTRALYEWYEAAGQLDPETCSGVPPTTTPDRSARIPGEGVVACVLESGAAAAARQAPVLGWYLGGWRGSMRARDLVPIDGAAMPPFGSRPRLYAGERSDVDHFAAPGGGTQFPDFAVGRQPLAEGSPVGFFGGAGLWGVGEALLAARQTSTCLALTVHGDACRRQGAAVLVSAGETL